MGEGHNPRCKYPESMCICLPLEAGRLRKENQQLLLQIGERDTTLESVRQERDKLVREKNVLIEEKTNLNRLNEDLRNSLRKVIEELDDLRETTSGGNAIVIAETALAEKRNHDCGTNCGGHPKQLDE